MKCFYIPENILHTLIPNNLSNHKYMHVMYRITLHTLDHCCVVLLSACFFPYQLIFLYWALAISELTLLYEQLLACTISLILLGLLLLLWYHFCHRHTSLMMLITQVIEDTSHSAHVCDHTLGRRVCLGWGDEFSSLIPFLWLGPEPLLRPVKIR